MKAKMLDKNGYDRLLRCSASSECMSILQEEGYFRDSATAGGLLDPTSWQRLSDAKMTELVKKLARLSPDDCAELLSRYVSQYRFGSLKSGLRLMVAHQDEELQSDTLYDDLKDDSLRGAVETRNVERLLEAVGGLSLYGEISSALAENKPLPIIEAIIDKHALTSIWNASHMRDWMDTESVQDLVGERIDATNLLLVVRSKALGISAEEVQEMLVPVSYRLRDALVEATNAGSTMNALRAFTKTVYSSSVERFLDTFKDGDSLYPLDVLLRRQHAASCLSTFSGFPFCAGLPLAFAYLIGYEMSDVQSIVVGKRDDLPIERIEQFLILQKAL
jgi:V/A-type H+-transporting ATPase subunit C